MPTIRSVLRKNRPTRRLRAVLGAGTAALLAATLAAPAADAAPQAVSQSGTKTGHYSGSADASLLRVSADLAGFNVASLDLTRTTAGADSDATPRTTADAENTGTLAALNGNVDLSTVLAQAHQTAPPQANGPDQRTLIPVPAAPLLDAGVSNASAAANWAGDGKCVASNQPLSSAVNDIAFASVLDVPNAFKLIGVNNAGQGVSYTQSEITLPATGGPFDERRVQAQSLTHIVGLDLVTAANQPPLVHVGLAQDYTATASASGLPGGAGVNLDDPVVNVSIAGQPAIQLTSGQTATFGGGQTPNTGIPTLDDILKQLQPILGPLAPIVQLTVPAPDRFTDPNGTEARISGSLLEVRVLSAIGTPPLATISLAPYSAVAQAPAGGIHCGQDNPITVTKSAQATVAPGDSFVQTIVVGNTDPSCTLTDVKVVDQLTGPVDSTITGTTPTADAATWPTVTWNNIGNIGPGQSVTLTVTVKVPRSAGADEQYTDVATASGTCNGTPYQNQGTLDRPRVVVGLLPRTGGEATFPLIGGAVLALAALGLRRLRTV